MIDYKEILQEGEKGLYFEDNNWRLNGINLLCSCLLWLDLYFGLRQDFRRLKTGKRL